MNINELRKTIERELEISETDLGSAARENSKLVGKYINLMHVVKLKYIEAHTKYKILFKQKTDFYSGRCHPDVYKENPFPFKLQRAEIQVYLDGDEELALLHQECLKLKTTMEYIETVVKAFNQRSWDIKNTIDWQKFTHGIG